MENNTSSYRSIFKATSVFGSVQLYQILVGIIKSKVIAVLLGPSGVGVLGLFNSSLSLLKALTSMGLQTSAVRDVSQANNSGKKERVDKVVAVISRLVWLTGLLGLILTIVLSPILSKFSFGNYDYTIPFILLSLTLLIDQLTASKNVILQGLRKIKSLATSSALGSTAGLIVSIPLYYLFGVNGIAPTLILTSLSSFIFAWLFAKKIHIKPVKIGWDELKGEGASMLKMGVAMSISVIFANLSLYILRNFISYKGGLEDVGLFTAGYMLMTTYTGLVFSAMATDYYPRLAATNQDNTKCREIINQQGEIGILILTPLLTCCVVFAPLIVQILYSEKFVSVVPYIMWSALGMLFKMASWSISYFFVAKGEAKMFATIEIVTNILCLILNVIGYNIAGLLGLGISFIIDYIAYLILVYVLSHKKYEFRFEISFVRLFTYMSLILGCTFIFSLELSGFLKYIVGVSFILLCSIYSIIELNKRLNIINLLNRRKNGKL